MSISKLEILFERGTLVFRELAAELANKFPQIKWDARTSQYRAPAFAYREIVLYLHQNKIPYQDFAKQFSPISVPLLEPIQPRSHQSNALLAWQHANSKGCVILPTGAGKTILAVLAINATKRPTLIHVPTIDLMHQWHSVLSKYFEQKIGLLGGGYNEIELITVATYDSAGIHVESKGNKFGLLVFDECHHLPAERTQFVALSSIAPFRLGLSATIERRSECEEVLSKICGPICFEADIRSLEGSTLARYEVKTLQVKMSDIERLEYDEMRAKYTAFVKQAGIDFKGADGWRQFIIKASRNAQGRDAFKAYLRQKKLSQASAAKEKYIWDLIFAHKESRILIFTQDNEMAYRIGKLFLLPVLTHHTKVKEREDFLNSFRKGDFSVLVTSKVLNEGVDVPEANVAIVVSGSGTVREHVQRLGRILRAQPGKKAILYELVSEGTAEIFVNQRRKQHSAYKRFT